ncbi:BrnA antitoxin family protein [Lentibacter algarum]|uniref:BrnA antitoxin family protein n=1 Tax=Lentibacter algarum TaxID=576131 RepID=UPI001C06E91A|nr:BrnA antitoxin family protein [Lentibacter algarum]MBU2981905.1 BrnA antitoxin family protein [Lentibacter algarum]
MTRRTKDSARIEVIDELKQLQDDLRSTWLDRSLPEGWSGLEQAAVTTRKKERITIRLDEDMLKWFRAQGPGYQVRINRILRIYWGGLISGLVQSHYSEDSVTPTFMEMVIEKARLAEEKRNSE